MLTTSTSDDGKQRQQQANLLPPLPSSDVAMLKTKNLNKLLQQNTSPHVTSAIIFTPAGFLLASSHSPTSPKTLRTQTTLAANIWCAYVAAHLPPSVTLSPPLSSTTTSGPTAPASQAPQIQTLTLEFSTSNLHITQIRPRLLLCLIGPATVSSSASSSATGTASPSTTTAGGQAAGGVGGGTRPTSSSAASTPPPPGTGTTTMTMTGAGEASEATTAPGGGSSRGSSTGKQRVSHTHSTAIHPGGGGTAAGGGINALGILRTQAEGLARWLEGELEGFDMPDMM